MKKIFGIVLALVLLMSMFSFTSAEETAKHKIGFLAPVAPNVWIEAVNYHVEQYCAAMNDKVEYKLCSSADAAEMAAQVEELKDWGAQAIVVYPHWEGMEDAIQSAIDAGIIVVNFDIEIDTNGVYLVTGDNEDMGVQGAHYIAHKLDGKGKVVILNMPTSASLSEQRTNGFLKTVGINYPDLKIIGVYATDFSRDTSYQVMQNVLAENPEIDAVYSIDDEVSIGILQAIKEAGRSDIKVITGGGGCQEYFKLMQENSDIWLESALYSPVMVKDAIDEAVTLLEGGTVATAVVIPTTVVDRDNVAEYMDENSPY